MRKSRFEAAATRERIVQAASAEFRRGGIEGTGLADLMGTVGLTHGGFYKHFASKEQLVKESLALAIDALVDTMKGTISGSTPGKNGLQAAIANYLSLTCRDNPAETCPYVALGSEVARGSDPIREEATHGLMRIADLIAGQLDGLSAAAAQKQALVMLSTMIGAVTMARIVTDEDLSATILRQACQHLIRAA